MPGGRPRQRDAAFIYAPAQIMAMAREAGFRDVRHVAPAVLAQRYFAGRTDGLSLSSAEEFLIAGT